MKFIDAVSLSALTGTIQVINWVDLNSEIGTVYESDLISCNEVIGDIFQYYGTADDVVWSVMMRKNGRYGIEGDVRNVIEFNCPGADYTKWRTLMGRYLEPARVSDPNPRAALETSICAPSEVYSVED